ncbi:hypothetical protein [uncultured Arcticibacterium sp.]|uniref:hypothetical protein n=1 Tax=uncultured Arcticibacterium sp. TaxID=2173042 RepID=UPI0030FAECC8
MFEFETNPFQSTPSTNRGILNETKSRETNFEPRLSNVYSSPQSYSPVPTRVSEYQKSKPSHNFGLIILIIGVLSFLGFFLLEKYWPIHKDSILLFFGREEIETEKNNSENV